MYVYQRFYQKQDLAFVQAFLEEKHHTKKEDWWGDKKNGHIRKRYPLSRSNSSKMKDLSAQQHFC